MLFFKKDILPNEVVKIDAEDFLIQVEVDGLLVKYYDSDPYNYAYVFEGKKLIAYAGVAGTALDFYRYNKRFFDDARVNNAYIEYQIV